MTFSALNIDFNGVSFDPLSSSVQVHQIRLPTLKGAVSATVNQSSKRMVADRHKLLHIVISSKHSWRAFR